MEFNTVDEEGRNRIAEYLKNTAFNGCEYSYAYQNAWLAKRRDCLKYAEYDGVMYITFSCRFLQDDDDLLLFLPPLTTMDKVEQAYKRMRDFAANKGRHMRVISAPREHAAMLDEALFIKEEYTDYREYLYNPADLIELKGKKYHGKRNHIAKFKKLYEYEAREYRPDDYEKVIGLFDIWNGNKEGEGSLRELAALREMLDHFDEYGLLGLVIYRGCDLVAFAIGELTANGVGIVHFEKADIAYEGAYSLINNLFAARYFRNARIINRQEDMGIEGLRKAKLSYYPIGYQEKWMITGI